MMFGMESRELLLIEAAEILGVSRQTLGEAIREDRLPAHKRGKFWFVLEADVMAYKARTQPEGEKPRGRPRKTSE